MALWRSGGSRQMTLQRDGGPGEVGDRVRCSSGGRVVTRTAAAWERSKADAATDSVPPSWSSMARSAASVCAGRASRLRINILISTVYFIIMSIPINALHPEPSFSPSLLFVVFLFTTPPLSRASLSFHCWSSFKIQIILAPYFHFHSHVQYVHKILYKTY